MKHFAIVAVVGLLASAGLAAPIYSEDFSATGTANLESSQIGWTYYFTAKAYLTDAINPQPNTQWNAGPSNPDGGFVNSFLGAGSTSAFGFRHTTAAADKVGLFTTDGSMGDVALAAGTDVADLDQLTFNYKDTWSVANPAAGIATWQLALKVDGQWYVSVASVGPAKDWTAGAFSITTDAAAWKTLAFTAGPLGTMTVASGVVTWPASTGQLALGSVATADLSGTVEALGFFVDYSVISGTTGNFNLAIDNVVLTPEPTTMAVLGLGSLALIRRRR